MLIHWYCRRLLKVILKEIEVTKKYTLKHKYRKRPDAYLFEHRGYKKIIYGCCCRYSAAFNGFVSWLERTKGHNIRNSIKRSVKQEKKSFERQQNRQKTR